MLRELVQRGGSPRIHALLPDYVILAVGTDRAAEVQRDGTAAHPGSHGRSLITTAVDWLVAVRRSARRLPLTATGPSRVTFCGDPEKVMTVSAIGR